MTQQAKPVRAGLIVPINNTTMERELLSWLPPGSTCITLRIPRGKGLLTLEAIPAYQAASLALAHDFPEGLDVIAYGCTAAGFLAGPAADASLGAQIAADTHTKVITTAGAMVAQLQAIEARSVDLVTPYSDAVNAGLASFMAHAGITLGRVARLHAPDVEALGRLTEADVTQAAHSLIGAQGDAVFIACSQLPTANILADLRVALGKPVLSSIQSTAAQALHTLREETHA